MIQFRTLTNINPGELLEVFNESFSDYFIPLKLSREQLLAKMKNENARLDYSVGAFDDDKLVGFMLHCYDDGDNIKKVYNAGTGVIPQYRGNNLTKKMYDFIIPRLKLDNAEYIVLEVLVQNLQAIKSYKAVGFRETREVKCFAGELKANILTNEHIVIKKPDSYNRAVLCSFWDIEPTWQNSMMVVENLFNTNISLGAYIDDILVGYIIFNPIIRRIQQLAVNKMHRKKGIAGKLITRITEKYGNQMGVINVDTNPGELCKFLTALGLKNNLSQYELIYTFTEQ